MSKAFPNSVFDEYLEISFNTLRLRQHGCHFPDDIFRCIFLNENIWIGINISLSFVPKGPIDNIPALVQIMAWSQSGDKPLSEPMMVSLPTHICVTLPQWVKIWCNCCLFHNWKQNIVIVTTLSSQVAPNIVQLTYFGTVSGKKILISLFWYVFLKYDIPVRTVSHSAIHRYEYDYIYHICVYIPLQIIIINVLVSNEKLTFILSLLNQFLEWTEYTVKSLI